MAIKGTTKIELTNINTGEKEVVEHHNMITNVLSDMNKRVYGVNGMDTFLYMYAKQFLSANDQFWKAMFSGIILFEDALSDNADEYIFPAGNSVTACGDIGRVKTTDMTDASCNVLGNFNSDESIIDKDNTVKLVYDFPTSQGNGKISSVALCNNRLARSCYAYGRNAQCVRLIGGNPNFTKNTYSPSVSHDGNVYTITFYYHDTENLKIRLSSRVNYGTILQTDKKTISVDLGASDYTYSFQLDDENILVLYSSTTKKFKYVCLTDGSVYEKDVPDGYDSVVPYGNYFIAVKSYNCSILKNDGTLLHENVLNMSGYSFVKGLFAGKYALLAGETWSYMINLETGGVSKLYLYPELGYVRFNEVGGNIFSNILHFPYERVSSSIDYEWWRGFSTWQPWLTTKNNLETPVTKTADKTMKVTYTLTEA